MCATDSSAFWKPIGRVGVGWDRRRTSPLADTLTDGSVSADKGVVLQTWKTAYSDLLNCNSSAEETVAHQTRDEGDVEMEEVRYPALQVNCIVVSWTPDLNTLETNRLLMTVKMVSVKVNRQQNIYN